MPLGGWGVPQPLATGVPHRAPRGVDFPTLYHGVQRIAEGKLVFGVACSYDDKIGVGEGILPEGTYEREW